MAEIAHLDRPARLRRRSWPWWLEGLVILVSYETYEAVRARVAGSARVALAHGRGVVALERHLWLWHERTVQGWFLSHHLIIEGWDLYYGTVHFVVPVVALVLLWRRTPDAYSRQRNALVVLTLLALVCFWRYPLAPPRLLTGPDRMVDTAATIGGMGKLDSGSMKDVENLYAAMPSLHVGWSAWCAVTLVPLLRRRWTRALAAVYPLVTLTAVVVTGNHYVLDGVGGVILLGVGWAVAGWAEPRRRRFWTARRADAAPAADADPAGPQQGTTPAAELAGPTL